MARRNGFLTTAAPRASTRVVSRYDLEREKQEQAQRDYAERMRKQAIREAEQRMKAEAQAVAAREKANRATTRVEVAMKYPPRPEMPFERGQVDPEMAETLRAERLRKEGERRRYAPFAR